MKLGKPTGLDLSVLVSAVVISQQEHVSRKGRHTRAEMTLRAMCGALRLHERTKCS